MSEKVKSSNDSIIKDIQSNLLKLRKELSDLQEIRLTIEDKLNEISASHLKDAAAFDERLKQAENLGEEIRHLHGLLSDIRIQTDGKIESLTENTNDSIKNVFDSLTGLSASLASLGSQVNELHPIDLKDTGVLLRFSPHQNGVHFVGEMSIMEAEKVKKNQTGFKFIFVRDFDRPLLEDEKEAEKVEEL